MMRYVAGIEYDGSAYSGWQRQPFLLSTIQTQVEQALSQVANHEVEVVCAGRTDAGVHALEQVIHFDTNANRTPYAWLAGTNRYLPPDIRLQWVQSVAQNFDARRSAQWREYCYCIAHGRQPSALWRKRRYWHRYSLNAEKMHEAAQVLCGEHDFSAFRAADCQSITPWRFIESITVRALNAHLLVVEIRGNAFLHHMVRNIVGTLLAVGDGRESVQWVAQVLASRSRAQAGVTAPAHGLYFKKVGYGAEFNLPLYRSALVDWLGG